MLPLRDWPLAERQSLTGLFTDIDDTLTHNGSIVPSALQALLGALDKPDPSFNIITP